MIELLIASIVIVILSGAVFIFFNNAFTGFINLQGTAIVINDKSAALERMAQVIRSATTISAATDNELTMYSYFAPKDSTLSQVTYSYDSAARLLKVDRIPATGTPPDYTYLPANKISSTILSNVILRGNLFTYQDANGGTGPFGADTYQDIKLITIDLNTTTANGVTPSELKTTVTLRNRKTNL
jgi:hypothetical protein